MRLTCDQFSLFPLGSLSWLLSRTQDARGERRYFSSLVPSWPFPGHAPMLYSDRASAQKGLRRRSAASAGPTPSLVPAWTFSHSTQRSDVLTALVSMNAWRLMLSPRDVLRHHSHLTNRLEAQRGGVTRLLVTHSRRQSLDLKAGSQTPCWDDDRAPSEPPVTLTQQHQGLA